MKLAIHHRENSFSDRWIEYCKQKNIDYLIVNCYDTNILEKLKKEKITHLMWHFHHSSSRDILISNYVFNAAEAMGVKTFPDFNTRWHFDDKCAQKYLFEALDIPAAKSFVFYSKKEAEKFLSNTKFPIVSKLRRGAGSTNVKLIHNVQEGLDNIEMMFDKGVQSNGSHLSNLDQKMRVAKKIKNPIKLISKVFNHIKKSRAENKLVNAEKGYVYYQEFMPNNDFDTRIIVIGDKAFGIRRFNRDNDFRASGSGKIDYDSSKIDISFVKEAFLATKNMKAQCLAFDFVYDSKKQPKIIEICYAFNMKPYDNCEGYWDNNLNFHKGKFNPQFFMIENLLN